MRPTVDMLKIPFLDKAFKFSTGKWTIVSQQPARYSMNQRVVLHFLNQGSGRQITERIHFEPAGIRVNQYKVVC